MGNVFPSERPFLMNMKTIIDRTIDSNDDAGNVGDDEDDEGGDHYHHGLYDSDLYHGLNEYCLQAEESKFGWFCFFAEYDNDKNDWDDDSDDDYDYDYGDDNGDYYDNDYDHEYDDVDD